MLRYVLIRYRFARRDGHSIFNSFVFALFNRKPPKQTDDESRARLKDLKKRWDDGD